MELLVVVAVLAAYLRGFIPVSETPVLVLMGWLSLRRRRLRWSAVGLWRPRRVARTLVVGLLGGIAYALISIYATDPFIEKLTGKPADMSEFAAVRGSVPTLLLWLLLSWTLGALGEELAYRGYVMNRAADCAGRTRTGWVIAVLLTSGLFAASHLYQGASGVISNFVAALLYSGLYFASGQNLWLPIVVHGVEDTVGFVLLYLGRYPGV